MGKSIQPQLTSWKFHSDELTGMHGVTQRGYEAYLCTDCGVLSTCPLFGVYLPSMKSDMSTVTGAFCFTAHLTPSVLRAAGAPSSKWLPSFPVSGTPHFSCLGFCKRPQARWRKTEGWSIKCACSVWRIFTSFQLGAGCSQRIPLPPLPYFLSKQTARISFFCQS